MITALSVKIPEKQKGLRAIAERLRRDRVEVEDREARGVRLRHVTYVSYSGELRLEKTLDAIGCQRGRVLCSERLIFPRASGFRRFSSTAFSSRICTNFALQTLSFCRSAPKLRVALYDPAACCPDLLLHLLESLVQGTEFVLQFRKGVQVEKQSSGLVQFNGNTHFPDIMQRHQLFSSSSSAGTF